MNPMYRRGLWPLLALGAMAAGGCDSLGQDLNDFAKNLMPPTPGEAARMAAIMRGGRPSRRSRNPFV